MIDSNNTPSTGIHSVTCVYRNSSVDQKYCDTTLVQVVTVIGMSRIQIEIDTLLLLNLLDIVFIILSVI